MIAQAERADWRFRYERHASFHDRFGEAVELLFHAQDYAMGGGSFLVVHGSLVALSLRRMASGCHAPAGSVVVSGFIELLLVRIQGVLALRCLAFAGVELRLPLADRR